MEPNKKEKTILIIEDQPQNLKLLGHHLMRGGFNVSVASTGKKGLEIARSRPPVLILLDIMMPDMDGYEVCSILKSDPLTEDIPVIFLTAKSEPEDVIIGLDMGGVDYISKPFNKDELILRVQIHIQLYEKREYEISLKNQMKELLHLLCHDLVNPIDESSELAKLICDDLKNVEKTKMDGSNEKNIKSSLFHSLEFINLTKNYLALDDGKLKLKLNSLNLKNSLLESCRILHHSFREKNIKIDLDVPDNINIYGEQISLINSVLNNLLTNSLKFSKNGEKVEVKSEIKDDRVILKISDHGMGMSEETVINLFNPLKNNPRKGTLGEGGTGLSMPLIKKYMESYNGAIEVTSSEEQTETDEKGTVISLTFQKAA